MSLHEALLATLARAAPLALCATLAAHPLAACLRTMRTPRLERAAAALLIAPLLTPGFLIGYGYSGVSLALVRAPLANQLLYAVLLAMKLTPVAVGLLFFGPPPPLTPSGRHCRRLVHRSSAIGRRGWRSWPGFAAHGSLRNAVMAFALVFLLAFQDFELASLLAVSSWTTWLFDAQVGGMPVARTLRAALLPLSCEVVVLAVAIAILVRTRRGGPALAALPRSSRASGAFAAVYIPAACAAVCLVPAVVVCREALGGFRSLLPRFPLTAELRASLLFASTATLAAFGLSAWCLSGRRRLGLSLAACVPGLAGALVLALSIQGLFQLPGLAALYDQPVLLWLALSLLLLPLAVALRVAIERVTPHGGVHLADLLAGSRRPEQRRSARRLSWSLAGRMRLLLALMLFAWAFFELVASAMLAPTGMIPASVRLYNLMHYGHSAVLSATVLAMVLSAAGLLLLAGAARLLYQRWIQHA